MNERIDDALIFPITLDNNIGGANFGNYGAVNSNASMQSPESQPFYDISDKLYASNQAVERSMENWEGFKTDFNASSIKSFFL